MSTVKGGHMVDLVLVGVGFMFGAHVTRLRRNDDDYPKGHKIADSITFIIGISIVLAGRYNLLG